MPFAVTKNERLILAILATLLAISLCWLLL
jgi:hypothetical protein